MYRVDASDPPEPEEALRLPIDARSSWLMVVLLASVGAALAVGLGLTRWQLEQATSSAPPVTIRATPARGHPGPTAR